MYKEIVVMYRVSKEWHIRLGKSAPGVYNENDGSIPLIDWRQEQFQNSTKRVMILMKNNEIDVIEELKSHAMSYQI